MTYKPDSYEEMEMPKPGTMEKTLIKAIQEGTLGQYVEEKNWEKYNRNGNASKDDPVIYVVCENGATELINLPKEGNKISSLSKLGRFKKTYGEYPREGMTVNTMANEKGFFQITLLD